MGLDPEVLEALRRNSGIRLSWDGVFMYLESKVPNPRVQGMFHQGLSVRDDGEVVLHVGHMWCYVACEGVARFVDHIQLDEGGARLMVRSRHQAEAAPVEAAGLTLGAAPDERFYLWLEPGAPPAVVTRPAASQLAGILELRGERAGLEVGETWCPVVELARAPGPADRDPGALKA